MTEREDVDGSASRDLLKQETRGSEQGHEVFISSRFPGNAMQTFSRSHVENHWLGTLKFLAFSYHRLKKKKKS